MNISRYFPVFAAAFCPLDVIAFYFNLPVFSYMSRTQEFHWGMYAAPPIKAPGPGMYYWGWTLTAALGAIVVAIIASFVPERIASRVSPGWVPVILACCVLTLLYLYEAGLFGGG
ncbi:MAG TPA: hypothetical protein VG271_07975 [Beijerinckiaceae bacterium]|jgi:hypothetical protein|nr:hypothetical protein [Beijerinckiaceae bacterium]